MSVLDALRLAVGTLSAVPVRVGRADRDTAGRAMVWAPAVGALLGGAAGGVAWLASTLGTAPLLTAAVAVATLAALTRGLHLDGLADVADGLGSGRPAEEALRIMKASDIGPFGVVTLVLALLVQVAALAEAFDAGYGGVALVTSAATGRLAITWACVRGVPAARPEGLGAWVAGTVPVPVATAATAVLLVAATLLGLLGGPYPAQWLLAPLAGLAAAAVLLHRAVRRLGGITGDVLGALAETAATVTLLALALG
ncbi:adenosylcobinamide-GDP ribazoletransferase [Carbonactinospora thermoautotrophica]|uniref:adenosylcobinamide-GDP ribazoletransferase n=1 Tax=Carbonactinospora thermoautotrophica TaxID=1469144 RepID=UPI000A8B7E3C|nr:adenosylcobinamide-GDP ribazoletransferase [Carbonactinospora thermoautotrophica]